MSMWQIKTIFENPLFFSGPDHDSTCQPMLLYFYMLKVTSYTYCIDHITPAYRERNGMEAGDGIRVSKSPGAHHCRRSSSDEKAIHSHCHHHPLKLFTITIRRSLYPTLLYKYVKKAFQLDSRFK